MKRLTFLANGVLSSAVALDRPFCLRECGQRRRGLSILAQLIVPKASKRQTSKDTRSSLSHNKIFLGCGDGYRTARAAKEPGACHFHFSILFRRYPGSEQNDGACRSFRGELVDFPEAIPSEEQEVSGVRATHGTATTVTTFYPPADFDVLPISSGTTARLSPQESTPQNVR